MKTKKINPKNYCLITDEKYDYFDSDIINMEIIEDGTNPTIDELTEKQAKQILCLALRRIEKYRKNKEKVLNHLINL